MSFLDTLKSLGLWQGQGQPQQPQANPYGLDQQAMRQAGLSALGNIGGQIMALSQQMTPDQRARMMAGADWTGGLQGNLYNAAQMKLMGDANARKQQEADQLQQSRVWLAEKVKSMPMGRQRDEIMFYLQSGDLNKAAERLYAEPSAEPPKTITIPVGDRKVTYQWNQNTRGWDILGEGMEGPSTVVNNTMGAGGADDFDKNLMKGVADAYVKAMEAGGPAQETKTAVMQLRTLLDQNGGALDGFSAAVTPYLPEGFVPEGANDLVAAQSIVAGLIPKQRVPGAGATSDYDARMFAQSLPNIWNKPGANAIILDTIEAYSDYRIAVADIVANVASDPSIPNKSGAIRDAIKTLPDPFVQWKKARGNLLRGAEQQVPAGGTGNTPEGVDLESALGEYN